MRDLLQYEGYGYTEEQINAFMRFADPKNEGKVQYYNFSTQIASTEKTKKKKSKKKK